MTLLEEAIEVAREYIEWRQHHTAWAGKDLGRTRGSIRPSCRDLVRELGRDMRPCCNAKGKAIAISIIAAEWMAMPERLTGLALTARSVDSITSIRPTFERHYDRAA